MAESRLRIDRVIRVTIWNHQTVSLIVEAGCLYIIRTGGLAAAATGSVFNEATWLFVGQLPDGSDNTPAGALMGHVTGEAIQAATKPFENMLTRMADKHARTKEARLSTEPPGQLATGWMSGIVPLREIVGMEVSQTSQQRVEGLIPQLAIKTKRRTYTLRFPQAPMVAVDNLAGFLRSPG